MKLTKLASRIFASVSAFALMVTGITIPTAMVKADDGSSVTTTYTLEASALTKFDKGAKADGAEESAGTDNYFTIIYSTKSKVDTSSKSWEDGYSSGQRINFGDKATTEKNAVKFTTKVDNAKVKIWWVEGGANNRQMAILGSDGTQIAVTSETLAQNAVCISTLTIPTAGTYYLGGDTGSNYIFKLEVAETVSYVDKDYTLESSSLTAFAEKAKADGDSENAGTDNFFTVLYSTKSKVDTSSKSWEDGYSSGQRISFGGKATTEKNAIKFTTTADNAKVKIWWAEGGDDNRQIAILGSDGTQIAVTSETLAKNAVGLSTLTIPTAGTYYLGGATNNNYIFKVVVTQKEAVGGAVAPAVRKAWSEVAVPEITSVTQNKGNVDVVVSAVIGTEGADSVTVTMKDEKGTETTKKSSKEGDSVTVSLTPTASGTYTFTVSAAREDEETAHQGTTPKTLDYVLPLSTPNVSAATNKGAGSVELSWTSVKEATSYIVTVDGTETKTSETTSAVLTGLTVGQTYVIGVKAARSATDKSEIGSTISVKVKEDAERTWSFAAYGSSTDTKNNGFTGSVNDGSLTVYSESGKGKIVPNSTDGLAFYYTKIDPSKENFTIEADITVDKWTLSNAQEGVGIMVADTVGVHGSTDTVWNNSILVGAQKVPYYYDSETKEVTNDSTKTKYDMKLGIGALVRLGVTAKDVSDFKTSGTFYDAANAKVGTPAGFTTETTPLETSATAKETGTYNIIGNATKEVQGTIDSITKMHLKLQRNNTGYIATYTDADGKVIGTKKIYDLERTALTQIDSENIYVGFFASRNARCTVTNVKFTTIDPSKDAAAEGRETEYVDGIYTIESASTANNEAYDLVYYGNVDGKITVKDADGKVIVADQAVKANEKAHVATTLKSGTNTYTVTITPDKDYKPGEYKEMKSYDVATLTHSVTYKTYSQPNLYVSPNGKATAAGSKADPIDIYTAVKYAKPGQTIVLAGGTYNLTSTVKVDRGIDGTKDKMIYMIADPSATERPVFDFGGNCAGMILGGNYWYFQGFDVTKSANTQKGIQVSGSNCTLDDIRAYRNGNTGIQVSRFKSTDQFDEWPANNLILNCTSYLNADAGYEDADGFAAKLTVGKGNVFDGCIAAYNADDGWDLYAKVETGSIGTVTIQNCVAFGNGYVLDAEGKLVNAGNGNGFKMGGESLSGYHTLKNSVAFGNKAKGIDSNSCPDIQIYDSTSFNNESYNVAFYTNNAVNTDFLASGLLSYKNSNDVVENFKLKGTQDQDKVYGDTNYYVTGKSVATNKSGTAVAENWFVSIDMDAVTAKAIQKILKDEFGLISTETAGIVRKADNTINMNGFLERANDNVKAGAVMSGKKTADLSNLIISSGDVASGDQATNMWTVFMLLALIALAGAAFSGIFVKLIKKA